MDSEIDTVLALQSLGYIYWVLWKWRESDYALTWYADDRYERLW